MIETGLVVQLTIGTIFLLATVGKLRHPLAFAYGVVEYEVLPRRWAVAFGLLLIPLEAFLALAHLSGWLLRPAAATGIAVLSAFAVAVALALKRHKVLSCHCLGGKSGELVSPATLGRLGLLIAGEALVLGQTGLVGATRAAQAPRVRSLEDLTLVLTSVLLVLMAGFWLLRAGEIAALLRPCSTCHARLEPDQG